MTKAQETLLAACELASKNEEQNHPGSGGWVEWYSVIEGWGDSIPSSLLIPTASRVWTVLERLGLVEDHPDPQLQGLVRPRGFGEVGDVNGVVYAAGYAYACGYHN